MPKVPLRPSEVADPFRNTKQDKMQDRMPSGSSFPIPSQAELLMAAAAMHQMGKFPQEQK